jgi:hypothetical protein
VRFFVRKPEEGSDFRRPRRPTGGKGRRMRPSGAGGGFLMSLRRASLAVS